MITLAILFSKQAAIYAQKPQNNKNYDPSTVSKGLITQLLRENESTFDLYPYEENYFLFTATNGINQEALSNESWIEDARDREVKYQISLALPISRGFAGENSVLGVSYTQRSWWQVFNDDISSPFRESNYEPQLFLGWATDYTLTGWSLEEIEIGLNHQSNGRSNPASRGWNRGYIRLMARKDNWQIDLKPWFLMGETEPKNNPDIAKYLGYYRLKVSYHPGKSIFAIRGRYNWNTGYGGAEVSWSYPISSNSCFYAQLFNGYGESLIDYNFHQTRFGIGLIMNQPW